MKILVTGGAGYIGSHTVIELVKEGYEPIIVDNLVSSHLQTITEIEKSIQKRVSFYPIDCCQLDKLEEVFEKEETIEGIIHFAAYREVGQSAQFPLAYYVNNLNSLANVLQSMQKFKCANMIFSSSCTVYGQAEKMPVTEQTPIQAPESVYGNTKQISEEMIHDFNQSLIKFPADNFPFKVAILRYFNPIGANTDIAGFLPMGRANDLIRMLVNTASGERDKLTVYGKDYPTPDGTCVRDYLHVVDLAKAHVKSLDFLCKKSDKNLVEIFNLGTGKGNSVLEIIKTFEEATGQKLPYQIGERRIGDVAEVYADVTKAHTILHWKAQFDLAKSLLDSWKWQQKYLMQANTSHS